MSIAVMYNYWQTEPENKKRMERELMLAMRLRWCNPPLRKIQKVGSVRLRGLLADRAGRRYAVSCSKRVPLRDWHERRI